MLAVPALALVGVLASWQAAMMIASSDIEMTRAAVMFSVLIAVSLVLFRFAVRGEPGSHALLLLLFLAFGVRLVAMHFRFSAGLLADAFVYNGAGREIARQLALGRLPEGLGSSGTQFVKLLVGLVYFVAGPTFYGISILWAWLGLVGALFFYKAFVLVFPNGNRALYRLLIFLYPSMALWTSSLGKDAPMILLLGMAAYGAARLFNRLEVVGLWWVVLGVLGMFAIRPHIAAAFALALAVSTISRPVRAGIFTPLVYVVLMAAMIGLSVGVIRTTMGSVGLENLGAESVFRFIEVRQRNLNEGGGAFQPVNPRHPMALLVMIPTVLVRPYIWEAHNLFALSASLEGLTLLVLAVSRGGNVWSAFRAIARQRYVLLISAFILLFIVLFSAVPNFGIIARQRVQLFPFVFMLLAHSVPTRKPA